MESLKKAVTIKGKAVYDIETLLISRLLIVGQQRHIDIVDEMSRSLQRLIDEYGCQGSARQVSPRLGQD